MKLEWGVVGNALLLRGETNSACRGHIIYVTWVVGYRLGWVGPKILWRIESSPNPTIAPN